MNEGVREDKVIKLVRTILDDSLAMVDGCTLERIGALRRDALNRITVPPSLWFHFAGRMRAGLLAVAVATAFILFVWLPRQESNFELNQIEELGQIAAGESFDFYDNLDFYRWLAKENSNG